MVGGEPWMTANLSRTLARVREVCNCVPWVGLCMSGHVRVDIVDMKKKTRLDAA